ncbi:hypothetical protein BVRB_2g041010 [Beta vulgaris subsp. vulgaris]|nr:hypothetical protein BVRB_2g041010 [Beta vulgaris subsp. vulgaris]
MYKRCRSRATVALCFSLLRCCLVGAQQASRSSISEDSKPHNPPCSCYSSLLLVEQRYKRISSSCF